MTPYELGILAAQQHNVPGHLKQAYARGFEARCRPLGFNPSTVVKRGAIGLLTRKARERLVKELVGRATMGGAAYAVQPRLEGLAADRGPRTGYNTTRALTALAAAGTGPRAFHRGVGVSTPRHAWNALSGTGVLVSPSFVRGKGESWARDLGWEGVGLPEDATKGERAAAALVGEDLVGGTSNMSRVLGELGTADSARDVFSGVGSDMVDRAKDKATEWAKETLPMAFRYMGHDLAGAGAGALAGLGIGHGLASTLRAPGRGFDMNDPEAVEAFYQRYTQYKRRKAAIRVISSALGSIGGLSLARRFGPGISAQD